MSRTHQVKARTRRYNVRHMAWGRLFGDRYKAVLVDGADTYHYRTLAGYIHLNPVRARLIQPKKGQSVLDYPWSSVAGGWAFWHFIERSSAAKMVATPGAGSFQLPTPLLFAWRTGVTRLQSPCRSK